MVAASVRRRWFWWVAMALIVAGGLLFAGSSDRAGAPSDDRLFALAEQLKCLQCVGESVAGSQAPLAEQFRDEIRAQMAEGASDDEILDYFVERYGQQVLLTPPSSGAGWLVWLLPLVVAGGAVVALVWVWPRWRAAGAAEVAQATEAVDLSSGGPGPSPESDAAVPAGASDEPAGAAAGPPGASERDVAVPSMRGRILAVVAVVGLVVVVGALLVQGTGQREPGTSAPVSSRDALARCRSSAMGDPAGAIDCYGEVLERHPEDVEALSYRGWAHLRSDDAAAAAADLDRAVELDPTYPDARVFRAIAATRAEDFDTASQELAAFFELDPEGFAVSIVESEGLERTIFFGRMSQSTAACWREAAGGGGDGAIDQAFLDALGACLDGVLATDPGDRDARFSRAVAEVGPDGGDTAVATSLLQGLLAEDAADADALGLLALVQLGEGDLDAAAGSIAALGELPRAPSAFLIGDVDTLRAALQGALDQAERSPDADDPDGG